MNDAVALSFAQTEYATALHGATRPTAATLTLRHAAALFQAGHYAQAQTLVAGLTSRVPPAAAARLSNTGSAAVAAVLLLVGADHALAAGDWRTAGADAAAVLLRYPALRPRRGAGRRGRSPAARRSRSPSTRGALAAAGHWTAARKAARQTLRIDPAYPGAAALLARIDATLARRKAATKAKAAASAAPAPTSTAPAAPTPVAPKPTPKPPPPP